MKLQLNRSSRSNPRYTTSNINSSAKLSIADFMLMVSLFCSFISLSASGQADCKIPFTYNWTVKPRTNLNIELGLPTTRFLEGYASEEEEGAFYYIALNSNKATLASHLSSDFCRDHEWIIDNVFKSNRPFYLLKLRTKSNDGKESFQVREVKIPMDSLDIFFDWEKRQIIINLPTITGQK